MVRPRGRGTRVAAFLAGVLYAFAPYHLFRGEGQLYLAAIYPIPLALGVVYLNLRQSPVWHRREGTRWWNALGWATPRTLGTVLCLAVVGTASTYYALFTILLLGFVVLVHVVRRSWRTVGASVSAAVTVAVVMLLNMAPDILYTRGKPPNLIGLVRSQADTETYALKLAQLVLPVPWERIGPLRSIRESYDATFPLPSEVPALGLLAAGGFLFLLAVIVLAPFVDRSRATVDQAPDREDFWGAQRRLAFLNVVGFLVGTVGGLSTLFALFVSSDIRGWNRISAFLALLAVASFALVLDAVVRWISRRGSWHPRAATALAVVLALVAGGIGLYDQTMPSSTAKSREVLRAYTSDQRYVDRIEKVMPADALIYQTPYLPFPEVPPLYGIADSDGLRMYLHSTDLRWTYGGIRGRAHADWAAEVDGSPLNRKLVELVAAGFRGINVDRAGYPPGGARQLRRILTDDLRVDPIVSRDRRFLFFDLADLRTRVQAAYSRAELAEIGSHTVDHAVVYWQASFDQVGADPVTGRPTLAARGHRNFLYIDSQRNAPTRVQVQFTLALPQPKPHRVRIRWPDGLVQKVVGDSTHPIGFSRTLEIKPGRSQIVLVGRHPNLAGLEISDTVLDDFPLRDVGLRSADR